MMQVKRGDIILSGVPEEKSQATQQWRELLIPTLEYLAMELGIYEPVFPNIDTWDGKTDLFPWSKVPYINERLIFTHIELAPEDGEFENDTSKRYVILRIKPTQTAYPVDMDVMLYTYFNPNYWKWYLLPMFGAFIRLIYSPDKWEWLRQEKIFDRWNRLFRIPSTGIPKPTDVMWGECLEGPEHTDINNDCFYTRTYGCSTRVMWSFIKGWEAKTGLARPFFYENRDRVNVIDSLSPGQDAFIFHDAGVVDIIVPEDQ